MGFRPLLRCVSRGRSRIPRATSAQSPHSYRTVLVNHVSLLDLEGVVPGVGQWRGRLHTTNLYEQ